MQLQPAAGTVGGAERNSTGGAAKHMLATMQCKQAARNNEERLHASCRCAGTIPCKTLQAAVAQRPI